MPTKGIATTYTTAATMLTSLKGAPTRRIRSAPRSGPAAMARALATTTIVPTSSHWCRTSSPTPPERLDRAQILRGPPDEERPADHEPDRDRDEEHRKAQQRDDGHGDRQRADERPDAVE